jgi:hypothetical protein
MKQTATEWLFKMLWDEPKDKLNWHAILNTAIEMERQQIVKSYADSTFESDDQLNSTEAIKQANQYYNQNYGK